MLFDEFLFGFYKSLYVNNRYFNYNMLIKNLG
jgi:hypothetical protein